MITIQPTPSHQFIVETRELINGRMLRQTVPTEGAAVRLAYSWLRTYIREKMTGWLHQRIVALQLANDYVRVNKASQLLYKLEAAQSYSVSQLCRLIIREEPVIHLLAPGINSRQYSYFKSVIEKIIYSCKVEEGLIKP